MDSMSCCSHVGPKLMPKPTIRLLCRPRAIKRCTPCGARVRLTIVRPQSAKPSSDPVVTSAKVILFIGPRPDKSKLILQPKFSLGAVRKIGRVVEPQALDRLQLRLLRICLSGIARPVHFALLEP